MQRKPQLASILILFLDVVYMINPIPVEVFCLAELLLFELGVSVVLQLLGGGKYLALVQGGPIRWRPLADLDQFNHEDQGGIGRHLRGTAARSVGVLWLNDQLRLLAKSHCHYGLVQAIDYLACARSYDQRALSLIRGVEGLLAKHLHTKLDLDLLTGVRHRAVTHPDDLLDNTRILSNVDNVEVLGLHGAELVVELLHVCRLHHVHLVYVQAFPLSAHVRLRLLSKSVNLRLSHHSWYHRSTWLRLNRREIWLIYYKLSFIFVANLIF